jgi:hypothetical protein
MTMTTHDAGLRGAGAGLVAALPQSAALPTDNGSTATDGAAERRGSAARQNAVQAAHRTDVNDKRANGKLTVGACGFAAIEADFRAHHNTNSARRRGPYEHYRLVYRYGYDLGADTRYRDADWSTVAQAACPRWEERNPGTWEQFKETIRYAWDTARASAEMTADEPTINDNGLDQFRKAESHEQQSY